MECTMIGKLKTKKKFTQLLLNIIYKMTNVLFQFVNGPCLQVLGYTREEMNGKEIATFQDVTPFLKQLERGFEWVGKIRWRTKSGDTLTLQCHAIPFSPGPG